MNKLIQYLKESRAELKKVVWPSRQQTRENTLVVIVVSLGVALFLGVIDFLVNLLLQTFL